MRINKNHNYFIQLCNCNSVLFSMEDEGYSSLGSILDDVKREYGMKVINGWKVFIRDNSVRDNEGNHPVHEYTVSGSRLVKW